MASFNRVILMGNLTRDVELKYLPSGMAVAEVGLAVNDRRKDSKTGQWVDETTFVDITMWGRTAEVASEYLSKGSPVLIEGRLKQDRWESEGQKRSKLKVICDHMRMVGSRQGGQAGSHAEGPPQYDDSDFGPPAEAVPQRSAAPARAAAAAAPPPDEIPF